MSLSIFEAAREAPDRTALVADGRSWSYAELAAGAREAVACLRARGIAPAPGEPGEPGEPGRPLVALRASTDVPTLEMLHGLMALGIPALLLHPRLTEAEERRIVAEAAPAAVVDGGWREAAAGSSSSAGPGDPPDFPPVPDDDRPLAVLHTSGTTGRPKGVVLSRRAFVASAGASEANLGWEPEDRWLLRLPVAHVGGLSVVTRCLLARRAVVLSTESDPGALLDTIERERVTILSLVPTLLSRLLDVDPPRPAPPRVRVVLLGGAAASPALLDRAAARGWPVLTTYGLTETCSQATTQPYGTVNRGSLGAGPPLPGMEVRIGDDGEIELRGPSLLTGYFPPGAYPAPFLPGGWLPTGDSGHLDPAGNLHVAGRRADRIVTGGENVDPLEVEQALEAEPGIVRACVFGVEDEEWGAVVCAALVARSEEAALAAVRGVADRLAPFKRPRRFAVLDALPQTRGGKLDRGATAGAAGARLMRV